MNRNSLSMIERAAIPPVILEMHQAGKGDLLRIVSNGRSIIVDSGTSDHAPTLRRLLDEMPCELLVLTHLDADHFGGLQQLVQDFFDEGKPNDLQWPAEIVVNDFEPRDAVESVRAVVGGDGQVDIDSFIAQAREWREPARELTHVMKTTGDLRPPLSAEAPAIVEVDDAAFGFLAASTSAQRRRWQFDEDLFDRLHSMAHDDGDPRIIEFVHDLVGTFESRNLFKERRLNGRVLSIDGGAVLVTRRTRTRQPGVSVWINDQSLLDETTGDIPVGLPPAVRGLLHLVHHGTPILESVKTASDTMTLVEALRVILGKDKVTLAQVEERPRITALQGALTLHVVGPDEPELKRLREKWSEIRERGRVHMRMQHTAFLEASFFAADAGRFRMDPSVTNRSSIQVVADAARGRAVLTGDGRPDTIERHLRSLPLLHCQVFKAAHHGSDHNIDLRQDPNEILKTFQPDQIWVSGGDKFHPAREFLRYLQQQHEHVKFEIAVTNANPNVQAMQSRLPIRVMGKNEPFTCDLNSQA